MGDLRKCQACPNVFAPVRSDNYFCGRSCYRKWRRWNKGALPIAKNVVDAGERRERILFQQSIRSAQPPRMAIGYKLYCDELEMWLPMVGSMRMDGARPKTDYYELRPTPEIPRVPLKTTYRLAWVYKSGVTVPTDPPHRLFVSFARDMRRTGEVGRRLKVLERRHELAAKEGVAQLAAAGDDSEESR